MSSTDNILDEIDKFKNTYYAENTKNIFFKKTQKQDVANQICQQFSVEELIQKTVRLLPNTNRVYIDYPVFKLYATPDNYKHIIEYVIACFNVCIQAYGNFECHINLCSFTMTAAERYKTAIEIFCKDCLKSETRYGRMLSKMYVYHSPGMIERFTAIFLHLIDPHVRDKFVLYTKEESDHRIAELFQTT
jgi:hypothetical protein